MPLTWFRQRDSIKEGHCDPVGVYVLSRGLEDVMKCQCDLRVAEGKRKSRMETSLIELEHCCRHRHSANCTVTLLKAFS
jgi:predicted transcriptional regulator